MKVHDKLRKSVLKLNFVSQNLSGFFQLNMPKLWAHKKEMFCHNLNSKIQGMHLKFGSAGAVCSIKENSGPQNQQVHIVLKASKSAGANGDVPMICGLVHPLHPC